MQLAVAATALLLFPGQVVPSAVMTLQSSAQAPAGGGVLVAPAASRQVAYHLATAPAAAAQSVSHVTAQADFIRSAQDAEGAIATAPDRLHVRPYLANFAAMGLAAATMTTGDTQYLESAWRWLAWYRRHMDRNGFVTDYDRIDGRLVSTGDMDSTDAYAGTYLLALRAGHRAAPARSRLAREHAGVAAAVRAIEATQDWDGLTWAKPSWQVKYLMDQAETYAGLRSAGELARTLGDAELAARAYRAAARLYVGVQLLWNPGRSSYDWAKTSDGARHPTDWRVFYPDAMEQAWAVAFGLAPGPMASAILSSVSRHQPQWDRPDATALFDSGGMRRVGYWVPVAWAYLRLGEDERASLGVSRIVAAAQASNMSWPYTPAEAGQIIVAYSWQRARPPGWQATG